VASSLRLARMAVEDALHLRKINSEVAGRRRRPRAPHLLLSRGRRGALLLSTELRVGELLVRRGQLAL
jgi:hypothetical protein